jgi:DNA modification methylase
MTLYAYSIVPIAQLAPYEHNPRTHSEAQIRQLRRSISEFGFTNPLLIDEQCGIIAGHGRLLAAIAEGLRELPCITVAGLSPTQRQALVIADNQLALNADWDDKLLAQEIAALKLADFDLSMLGFSDEVLAAIANADTEGKTDPDEIPEAPAEPITRERDVWLLGKHRLMCGSSTVADQVAALLGGAEPHLMVTDPPPYGVEYDADWRNHALRADGSASNGRAIGQVTNDDRSDWREAWSLFPGDVAYVWHAGRHASSVQESLESVGFEIRCQLIWAKQQFAIGRGHYHWMHEPCWYAVRRGKTAHWSGDRKQTTVWEIDKPQKSETGHSTQKPVECMKRPIENNSVHGDSVYEPFSGSGTTIIAAEMTERTCYAMEIHPPYVDVAVLRWQAFTGHAATLESDGRTFAEISSAHATR